MDADRATLWLWQAGVTRKIASHGCDIPFRSLIWDFDAVDYQPDERVVIAHALISKGHTLGPHDLKVMMDTCASVANAIIEHAER